MKRVTEAIEILRELEKKATAAPWELTDLSEREIYVTVGYEQTEDGRHKANWIAQIDDGDDDKENETMYTDAEFIVAMRNAAPQLLDAAKENERLRSALEQIEMGGYQHPETPIFIARQALQGGDGDGTI